ncbi:hypothetical protein [Polynucleobacter sp. JS-Fieb-80-E5]|uniref:hypothetical protein n=1 Tax=Polynucleobacter sp. JS-Fieb-80-E5 TaxID=2081050 RepID=UPI001C0B0005|nr:hypothetical protein [Polynucleobacter sp. JS-Fieb-80-E5]MBU3618791.1 hypothetical protein [Polynucleobacter sp. JS-Fieb-80-E5]
MKNQSTTLTKYANTERKTSLSTKFHQYIVDKTVDWALNNVNGKTRFSKLKWSDKERALLNQIIANPEAADLKLPIQDSKFKRFFKSIAENGLNTFDVEKFYQYRDRLPLRDLQWEFKKEDFTFTKTKAISKAIIPAGYYMLELGIKTSQFSSQIGFDLKTVDQTKSKHQEFELQAKSIRISKRLICLENNSKLEASLPSNITASEIYHLRLARLTKNFFLSRMFNKIGGQFDIKKCKQLSQEELKVLWNRYDSIFKRHKNPFTEYEYYIEEIEAKQTPSRTQQLRNLQLWMMKNRQPKK